MLNGNKLSCEEYNYNIEFRKFVLEKSIIKKNLVRNRFLEKKLRLKCRISKETLVSSLEKGAKMWMNMVWYRVTV